MTVNFSNAAGLVSRLVEYGCYERPVLDRLDRAEFTPKRSEGSLRPFVVHLDQRGEVPTSRGFPRPHALLRVVCL